MRHVLLLSVLAAGCGPSENAFIPEYADLFCSYYLDCADQALLVFDGVDTVDDCLALFGPDIAEAGTGCELKGSTARKCLKSMELLSCPSEGVQLEDGIPPVCDAVWIKCIAQPGTVESNATP